jgi:sulfate permease, SulP family
MAALVGVLLLGILKGVLLAALVSFLMLLHRAALPRVAVLGRIPGTRRYSDFERHPDNERVPGALLLRVEASIFYFNAEHVRDMVRQRLRSASGPVRLVVFDLSTSPLVDVTGAMMLGGLQKELAAAGVAIRFVEARAEVRHLLRTGDTRARVGQVDRRISLDDVVRELEASPAGGTLSG